MEKQEFLDYEKVLEKVQKIYNAQMENYIDEENGITKDDLESYTDARAEHTSHMIVYDMRKYAHQKDTKIIGNFNDIRRDFEYVHSGIKFDEVVKKLDAGEMADEELADFQSWCFDWFWDTFGTYNLGYNFGSYLGDFVYGLQYEREHGIA